MRKVMMRVYKYGELPEKVREKVRERAAADLGYHSADDAIKSLREGVHAFNVPLVDYSVDFFGGYGPSSIRFGSGSALEFTTLGEALEIMRALDRKGDCPLTGVCFDVPFLETVRKRINALKNDGVSEGKIIDLEDILREGFLAWLDCVQADAEYQYSDAGYQETSDANEWEYTEDGKLWTGKGKGQGK